MIEGLKNSLVETELLLKNSITEKDEVIEGLKRSKTENAEMIQGLENSLAETEKYLQVTVEKWKQTVNEIYNSSTWKLVSKFTKAQTKTE